MKYNKNADTLLFLPLFTTGQRENYRKPLFVSAGAQKKVKNSGFWECFTGMSTES